MGNLMRGNMMIEGRIAPCDVYFCIVCIRFQLHGYIKPVDDVGWRYKLDYPSAAEITLIDLSKMTLPASFYNNKLCSEQGNIHCTDLI